MDGFSYYNIFDTKGIEYLAIIAFLLLLIPFWLALNKQSKIKTQIRKVLGTITANILKIPQGVFLSKNHTWAYLEKSGVAKVGLDDLMLHITGEVEIHPLKYQGDMIKRGDLMAKIDQNGKILNIFSPVSGKIVNANPVLKVNHKLLQEDPYGKGWIYNIQPSNWVEEIPTCYLAEEATDWLKQELERYKDFLSVNMPRYASEPAFTILQDGGELSGGSLSGLPEELWKDFQQEFLNLHEK